MNSIFNLRGPRKLKGFTLLELIVVMAIIGTLAAIIIPNTIQMMRDSRIESANGKAKDLYVAAQNYLTDCQIKRMPMLGEPKDNPAFPANGSETGTNHHNLQSICFYGGAKGCQNENIVSSHLVVSAGGKKSSASPATQWNVLKAGTPGSGKLHSDDKFTNADGTGTCDKFMAGIAAYMGATFDASTAGACFLIIDVDTYSVVSAYYCEEMNPVSAIAGTTDSVGNRAFLLDDNLFYSQIFGGSNSQQSDTNDYIDGNAKAHAYVGQYPIA